MMSKDSIYSVMYYETAFSHSEFFLEDEDPRIRCGIIRKREKTPLCLPVGRINQNYERALIARKREETRRYVPS